jgi:hypothetical protein
MLFREHATSPSDIPRHPAFRWTILARALPPDGPAGAGRPSRRASPRSRAQPDAWPTRSWPRPRPGASSRTPSRARAPRARRGRAFERRDIAIAGRTRQRPRARQHRSPRRGAPRVAAAATRVRSCRHARSRHAADATHAPRSLPVRTAVPRSSRRHPPLTLRFLAVVREHPGGAPRQTRCSSAGRSHG